MTNTGLVRQLLLNALVACMLLMNIGCAAVAGSAIGYGIGTITGGLEAGKGADRAADCPSCIRVQNYEEARSLRERIMKENYSSQNPQPVQTQSDDKQNRP